MRPILIDPDLNAQFEELGWVVVPFLSPEEVDQVVQIYRETGPAPGDPRLSIFFDYQSGSPDYKRAASNALRPIWERHAADILDDYELFYPEFIMKWPGYRSGFAPHQDVTFVDESKYRTVSIWVPMVDVTGEDGADAGLICMLPGSHRWVEWPQAWNPEFPFSGLERDIIEKHSVGVPVRAGEGLVFDHRIVHFSLPNNNPVPRLVCDGNFRPREAEMYHYRSSGEGSFDLYAIDEEFFFDTNPALLSQGPPEPDRFVRSLTVPRPTVTAEDLERWCRDVKVPTGDGVIELAGRLDGDDYWYEMGNSEWRSQAVPFCASCGTEEAVHPTPEDDLGYVKHLCATCDPDGVPVVEEPVVEARIEAPAPEPASVPVIGAAPAPSLARRLVRRLRRALT